MTEARTRRRAATRSKAAAKPVPPDLRIERGLLRTGVGALACADEAGRGALSGPVSVGMVVVTTHTPPAPQGVRDSKLLRPAQRDELVPKIQAWAAHAVGMASAPEIDRLGIMAALRLAGQRALSALPIIPDCVLLDGNVDYLSSPGRPFPRVITRVQADRRCAGVAAASILAKTARDSVMIALAVDFPMYGWSENKGYAAPAHLEALRTWGPSPHHRVSWRLPASAGESRT